MPPDDFNYTLQGKTYGLTDQERSLLDGVQIDTPEEWKKGKYISLKSNIKSKYLKEQSDRCGYCRVYVEPEGLYVPLEHIVAKSQKPKWMFNPVNLSVACHSCNNQKGTEPTLAENYNGDEYPQDSQSFTVFHPHFESWNDHLEIENDMFIKAKDTKGENTLNAYKLTRPQIPINFSREQKIGFEESARRVAYRLTQVSPGSDEYNELMEALEHYKERI